MLFGHPPHILKPGDYVLVWGGSGGLGVFGVQLAAASGAYAIGVISDESKRDYVMDLGARGAINRKDFKCWGAMPKVGTPEYTDWVKEARRFGKAISDITGKRDVDIVFEHPGEETFPVSCLVVKRGGMTAASGRRSRSCWSASGLANISPRLPAGFRSARAKWYGPPISACRPRRSPRG